MSSPLRVVGYVRVSTDEQSRDGVSLGAQEDRIREFCRSNGYELVTILHDPGESGGTLDRPGIRKALELLDADLADALVVTKLDRLTRAVRDLCFLLDNYFGPSGSWRLLSLGETVETKTANGRMILYILTAVAQGERELAIERTVSAVEHKRTKNERLGTIPYGFMVGEDGKSLVPCQTEKEAIGLMRLLKTTGESTRGIAAELTRRGYPTRSGAPSWSASSVRSVLSREAFESSVRSIVSGETEQ